MTQSRINSSLKDSSAIFNPKLGTKNAVELLMAKLNEMGIDSSKKTMKVAGVDFNQLPSDDILDTTNLIADHLIKITAQSFAQKLEFARDAYNQNLSYASRFLSYAKSDLNRYEEITAYIASLRENAVEVDRQGLIAKIFAKDKSFNIDSFNHRFIMHLIHQLPGYDNAASISEEVAKRIGELLPKAFSERVVKTDKSNQLNLEIEKKKNELNFLINEALRVQNEIAEGLIQLLDFEEELRSKKESLEALEEQLKSTQKTKEKVDINIIDQLKELNSVNDKLTIIEEKISNQLKRLSSLEVENKILEVHLEELEEKISEKEEKLESILPGVVFVEVETSEETRKEAEQNATIAFRGTLQALEEKAKRKMEVQRNVAEAKLHNDIPEQPKAEDIEAELRELRKKELAEAFAKRSETSNQRDPHLKAKLRNLVHLTSKKIAENDKFNLEKQASWLAQAKIAKEKRKALLAEQAHITIQGEINIQENYKENCSVERKPLPQDSFLLQSKALDAATLAVPFEASVVKPHLTAEVLGISCNTRERAKQLQKLGLFSNAEIRRNARDAQVEKPAHISKLGR